MSKNPKRREGPAEVIGNAIHAMPIATGQIEQRDEVGLNDPHASALGRLGGQARAAKLSKKRRKEIAKKAAAKRWGRMRTAFSRMSEPSEKWARDVILDVVIDLLETDGYHAVQLREVAKRARVSLSTIYHLFPTRDELIVSAVERWLDARVYAELATPRPDESLYESLMQLMRTVFEPWEQHPRMLDAFHRARAGPGGERLAVQGHALVAPVARALLGYADPDYVSDMELIVGNVVYGLIARFTEGQISITDILPALERTVRHLTAAEASGRRPFESTDRPPTTTVEGRNRQTRK